MDSRGGNNNPINPISKVAALTIDRGNLKTKAHGSSEVPVIVSLTFNRRKDMTGIARTKDGQTATVKFSLMVTHAAFDLRARFADDALPGPALRFTDLAHIGPAAVVTKKSMESKAVLAASLRGKASGEHLSDASSTSVGEGKKTSSKRKVGSKTRLAGDGAGEVEAKKTVKSVSKSESLNINGTSVGSRVSWTIEKGEGQSALVGSVFQSPEGKELVAAVLHRNGAGGKLAFEIEGVVRALMADVVISDVAITDARGDPLQPDTLTEEIVGSPTMTELMSDQMQSTFLFRTSALRTRVVREILRKHIGEHGLDTVSADIEICRAQG
jgi:hypothetical protein